MAAASHSDCPDADNPSLVGSYPALAFSGGGYFYDQVLEYRVWVHPELGGEARYGSEDYFFAFKSYSEAVAFSVTTPGAEEPLVLIRQLEHINEPSPGVYEHVTGERVAEWQVPWLKGSKRSANSIADFLSSQRRDA